MASLHHHTSVHSQTSSNRYLFFFHIYFFSFSSFLSGYNHLYLYFFLSTVFICFRWIFIFLFSPFLLEFYCYFLLACLYRNFFFIQFVFIGILLIIHHINFFFRLVRIYWELITHT